MKKSIIRMIGISLCFAMVIQLFNTVCFAEREPIETADSVSAEKADEPEVVCELSSKRQANVKHFKMSDGTFTAASYYGSVHYECDGQWIDIDNSLVEATDPEDRAPVLENKDNPFKVKFAQQTGGENIVKISKDDYSLAFSLSGVKSAPVQAKTAQKTDDGDPMTLEKTQSEVKYVNIVSGIDVEYTLNGEQLKENIIIKEKLPSYSVKYIITANGVELSLENNTVLAKDGDETVFVIPAPYMYDSDGEFSSDVVYSLERIEKGKYALSVVPNKEWIEAEERVFPVTVDPTVQSDLDTSASVYAVESANNIYHYTGLINKINTALYFKRFDSLNQYSSSNLYMRFELPYLSRGMTSGQSGYNQTCDGICITNAELRLISDSFLSYGTIEGDAKYSVHRNTSAWTNGFTQNTAPEYLSKPECILEKTALPFTEDMDNPYLLRADITDLVKSWYSSSTANNGVYIKKCVDGSDVTQISHNLFPSGCALYISYIDYVGIKDYFTYTSTDIDELGTGHINNLTGSLNYTFTDWQSNNIRNGVSINHVYSDEYAVSSYDFRNNELSVGKGFKLNIQQYAWYNPTSDYWVYYDETGSLHYYNNSDNNSTKLSDDDGFGTTISKSAQGYNTSSNSCTIEYQSGTKYKFVNKLLTSITDKNGNEITITWASTGTSKYYPTYVNEVLTSSESRKVKLIWDTNDGTLTRIEYPDGDKTEYSYSGTDKKLSSVTFDTKKTYSSSSGYGSGNNNALSFTYNNSLISAASSNIAGKRVEFSRDTPANRITGFTATVPHTSNTSVLNTVENVQITYERNSTTVKNNLTGYFLSYVFNDRGLTSCVADNKGGSKYYNYGATGGAANKITFESLSRKASESFIKNGCFASTGSWTVTNATINTSSNTAVISSGGSVYQSVGNLPDGTYTISADIKCTSGKAKIALQSNGSDIDFITAYNTSEFERRLFSVNISSNNNTNCGLRISSLIGSVYVRNVQIVLGNSSAPVNLLENSSFRNSGNWTTNGFAGNDGLSNYCLMFGDYSQDKYAYQTISNGNLFKNNTTYVFGANVKAYVLPNSDIADNENAESTCIAIIAKINYSNNSAPVYKTVLCEPDTGVLYDDVNHIYSGGYYINQSGYFTVNGSVERVEIYLKNSYNYGIVVFDDVYLYEDASGTARSLNAQGNPVSVTNAAGNSSSAVYAANGIDVVQETDALGKSTYYTYDSQRNLTQSRTHTGITSDYTYDTYGNNLSAYTGTVSNSSLKLNNGSTEYTNYGTAVYKTKDAFGNANTRYVNSNTLRANASYYYTDSATTNDNIFTRNEYIYYGNSSSSYNNIGPLKSVAVVGSDYIERLKAYVSYDYDNGRLKSINRNSSKYQFDTIRTDENTFIESAADVYQVYYNTSENISVRKLNGSLLHNLSTKYYDENGNLVGYEYGGANGIGGVYKYDSLNRLKKSIEPGRILDYSYDKNGNVTGIQSSTSLDGVTNVFDTIGRLSQTSYASKAYNKYITNKLIYNERNSLTSFLTHIYHNSYNAAVDYTTREQYDYDDDGKATAKHVLSGVSGSSYAAPKMNYIYNLLGMRLHTRYDSVSGYTLDNSLYRAYEYNTNNAGDYTTQVKNVRNRFTPQNYQTDPDYVYNYTYDSIGNITGVSGTGALNTGESQSFTYDALNQVKSAYTSFGSYFPGELDESFTYVQTDDAEEGNIASRSSYNYDQMPEAEVYTYTYDSNWTDRLLTVKKNGVTIRSYSYDDMPVNPTSDGRFDFSWDGRRLTGAFNINNGDNLMLEYDCNGNLARKSKVIEDTQDSETTEYYYSGGKLALEVRSHFYRNTTVTAYDYLYYTYDDEGLAFIEHVWDEVDGGYIDYTHTDRYWVSRNAQGDIKALVHIDDYGNMENAVQYFYSAFGEQYVWVDMFNDCAAYRRIAEINPITYRGYYYDRDLEMYYLQSRYYDPVTCRFLNGDDQISGVGGDILGYNMFAYCNNNPVNRVDSDGHAWWHWALAATVVVACAVAVVATAGGAAAGIAAVAAVANGVAASTTASTVAAAAFIGSATVLGCAALDAASTSTSAKDFADQGNWGTVAAIAGGAVVGGFVGYKLGNNSSYGACSSGERGTQNAKVKAAIEKGQAMHKQMDYGPGVLKEQTIAPGCRVDGIDFDNHIIYELKPNNPQAIARGIAQLNRYTIAAHNQFGGEWTGVLKLY